MTPAKLKRNNEARRRARKIAALLAGRGEAGKKKSDLINYCIAADSTFVLKGYTVNRKISGRKKIRWRCDLGPRCVWDTRPDNILRLVARDWGAVNETCKNMGMDPELCLRHANDYPKSAIPAPWVIEFRSPCADKPQEISRSMKQSGLGKEFFGIVLGRIGGEENVELDPWPSTPHWSIVASGSRCLSANSMP